MSWGQWRKYQILTRILDGYVREGQTVTQRRRFFDTSTEELENHARSRAFIHLYLAATYGLVDFEDREHMITDGQNDGGIDAYFIDREEKRIDVIQAKFRATSTNFEEKYITPEELLSIDLDRILEGHRESSNGTKYNGFIQAFIDKIAAIPDIARYNTRVVILANVKADQFELVGRLFPGDHTEVVNFEQCYTELVLPTLRSEQHYTQSMRLQLDLSNKSGASRLSAEILTAHGPSEVTVVLVPTIEIARLMSRYKNSILRYNPRSYLEFREQRTNEGIQRSITENPTGEFAILNNGITMVSDETYVNERVGAKNKAQIEIVNPQMINGGQTAFTLSRIYDNSSDIERIQLFEGKEVILRIITLPQIPEDQKKELIFSISSATNSQTAVSAIDRSASNDTNREIAEIVFLATGLLYEPKRGEYSEAIHQGHIDRSDVIERSLFTRLMYMATGNYALAAERKVMRATGGVLPELNDKATVGEFLKLYETYLEVSDKRQSAQAAARMATDLALTIFARALLTKRNIGDDAYAIAQAVAEARRLQPDLDAWGKENITSFTRVIKNKATGASYRDFLRTKWKKSKQYPDDVDRYVALLERVPAPDS